MSAPHWRRWLHEHDKDWVPDVVEVEKPTLTLCADDPVIGRIYGPTGAVVKVIRPAAPERPPFGFS